MQHEHHFSRRLDKVQDLALASRGWQYMSKYAFKSGHAQHIHANCDCAYAVRFDGQSNVEGYEPERYLRMCEKAERGNSRKKINHLKKELLSNQTGGKKYFPYDSNSKRDVQAAEAYRIISRNSEDIEKIAESSGMAISDIKQIKRHIFFDKHKLYEGYGMLSPDYDMAVAWKRLSEGIPEKRDIVLLKHELPESIVEKEYNLTVAEAHKIAKDKYDWESAVIEAVGETGEKDGLL